MRDHPRGRFGRVRYDAAELGLDMGELEQEYDFYMSRFDLRREY